jgi:hypothetical protein
MKTLLKKCNQKRSEESSRNICGADLDDSFGKEELCCLEAYCLSLMSFSVSTKKLFMF